MLSNREINILGQIFDTTWGNSSTVSSPSRSIKASLSGNVLTVSYSTLCHLANDRNLRQQVRGHEEESMKICDEYMRGVRRDFKANAQRALKVKQLDTDDSVEIISASPYAPRRTAYYRRVVSFEIA